MDERAAVPEPGLRPRRGFAGRFAKVVPPAAHIGLVRALLVAGRHGEARRRYGIYADRMEEMAVEAAPFPSVPGRVKVA